MANGKYCLGLYEKSMPPSLTLKERLIAAGEAGYDYLEMSIDESDERLARLEWTSEERAQLKKDMKETGVGIRSICLSAHRRFPLGSMNNATVKRSKEILEKAILLAYDLNIRLIQLAGYDVYYEPGSVATRERFDWNLHDCLPLAAHCGVMLAFETMETPFMNTVAKATTHCRRHKCPWLQIYPDLGNLTNSTVDVPFDLSRGGGRIAAVHLKESAPGTYRDLFPGEGHVDFEELIAYLKTHGVYTYTAEFWYREGDDWKARLKNIHDYYRRMLQ